MKKLSLLAIILGLILVAGNLGADYGSAFRSPFTILWDSIKLDHTYFCLNGTTDCHSITGWGIPSGNSGGDRLWETYGYNNSKERCASRSRASNNVLSPCYIIYGVTGVCHMQTNRGLASFGKRMNHSNILGGWASATVYGYYGGGWTICKSTSNVGCGRWPWER